MLEVLLIEDDIIDQLTLSRLIKKNKLECSLTTAVTIEEARTKMQSKVFDLVVCDLNLPDGLAFDLGNLINKQPFILLSGHLDEENIHTAKQHGAIQVLQKSSDLRQLTSIQDLIKSMLEKQPGQENTVISIKKPLYYKFNVHKLLQIFDQQSSEVINILELFLNENPGKLQELDQAIATEDRTAIYHSAHKLKNNFNFLDLKHIHKIASSIENQCKVASFDQLRKQYNTLYELANAIYPEIDFAIRELK